MYQKITIVGNLTRDPEMRYTQSGKGVTSFTVATNRNYTTAAGEKVKETMYFKVSVWGKRAETNNQYLSKGAQVMVEGRLTGNEYGAPRIWTNQDGDARASFEINANDVVWLKLNSVASPAAAREEQDDFPF